ncbi:MAG: hypothetical protein HOO89_09050 [Ferruginibacter sp.]|nr:hypothetical protein [Ferruginibacter sp.]NOU38848.1 hypothetical protein [Ferruginibacter sp.]
MENVIKISKHLLRFSLKFSICTIVNNHAEYALMKKSFEENDFLNDCEFIIADNSKSNEFDAYEAISYFLKIAKGEFIIIVHQDVRVIDNKDKLEQCLQALETKDNTWAVCGNAGGAGYKSVFYHIDDNGVVRKSSSLPKRVFSLDENFLVLKNSKGLSISSNLKGFHLYGTDISIIADFLGYSVYVIPFMVLHLSSGNLKDLKTFTSTFIKLYGHKLRHRFIQTTCTKFLLSNSVNSNIFYNNKLVFFFVKIFS